MFVSFVGLLWGHGRLKEESIRLQVGLGQLIQVLWHNDDSKSGSIAAPQAASDSHGDYHHEDPHDEISIQRFETTTNSNQIPVLDQVLQEFNGPDAYSEDAYYQTRPDEYPCCQTCIALLLTVSRLN